MTPRPGHPHIRPRLTTLGTLLLVICLLVYDCKILHARLQGRKVKSTDENVLLCSSMIGRFGDYSNLQHATLGANVSVRASCLPRSHD